MSPASILYVVGSALFFMAERFFSTNEALRYPLWLLSGVLVLMAAGQTALKLPKHGVTAQKALAFMGLSLASAIPYAMVSLGAFGLDKTGQQLASAATALTPLLWLVGALPAMFLARTMHANPHGVHPLRARAALEGGLALALGLGMLFPINYLASEYNRKWDFGYFRTTDAGEGTRLVVENAPEPMRALLFFSAGNEVQREAEAYFAQIAGPNLTVERADQQLDPDLAKQYKVRENGTIAIIRGDRSETIKLGEDLDKARKDLRKLDGKVHTALLKLASEKKTAYFTVGHDEMFWKNAPQETEKIDLAKKFLEGLNFKVKEYGLDDGLGVEVPEDAAILFVVGPKKPMLPAEIDAIRRYRDNGGSVYLMLEPGAEVVDTALLALFGVETNNTIMVTDKEKGYAVVSGGLSDRAFVATSKFSSHESITNLQKRSTELFMVTPTTGGISEAKEHPGKYTAILKGMPEWFPDYNGNYAFDKDADPAVPGSMAEKRGSVDIAAAITGPASDGPDGSKREWRAIVMSDATWLSNVVVLQVVGNQAFFSETMGWLVNDPLIGGEQESEEDIKIQHTKESQQYWFLGAIVGMPGLVMLAGTLNVLRRRSRS